MEVIFAAGSSRKQANCKECLNIFDFLKRCVNQALYRRMTFSSMTEGLEKFSCPKCALLAKEVSRGHGRKAAFVRKTKKGIENGQILNHRMITTTIKSRDGSDWPDGPIAKNVITDYFDLGDIKTMIGTYN